MARRGSWLLAVGEEEPAAEAPRPVAGDADRDDHDDDGEDGSRVRPPLGHGDEIAEPLLRCHHLGEDDPAPADAVDFSLDLPAIPARYTLAHHAADRPRRP